MDGMSGKDNVWINTERLQFRVWHDQDLDHVKQFWGDVEVMKYSLGATPHDKLLQVMHAYNKLHEERGISVYAVIERASGDVIGACGFNPYQKGVSQVELIYHFARSSWGKGYATEAVRACVQMATHHGGIRRIHASCDPHNIGSIHVLDKSGFTYIGMQWYEDTKQEEPTFERLLEEKDVAKEIM